MGDSTFSKGIMTMADGMKYEVTIERKENENGGVDITVLAPKLIITSQSQN